MPLRSMRTPRPSETPEPKALKRRSNWSAARLWNSPINRIGLGNKPDFRPVKLKAASEKHPPQRKNPPRSPFMYCSSRVRDYGFSLRCETNFTIGAVGHLGSCRNVTVGRIDKISGRCIVGEGCMGGSAVFLRPTPWEARRAITRKPTGGPRPDDRLAVPLCAARDEKQHRIGALSFWSALRIDPFNRALRLLAVSADLEAGSAL
jgi:hypothetical protein